MSLWSFLNFIGIYDSFYRCHVGCVDCVLAADQPLRGANGSKLRPWPACPVLRLSVIAEFTYVQTNWSLGGKCSWVLKPTAPNQADVNTPSNVFSNPKPKQDCEWCHKFSVEKVSFPTLVISTASKGTLHSFTSDLLAAAPPWWHTVIIEANDIEWVKSFSARRASGCLCSSLPQCTPKYITGSVVVSEASFWCKLKVTQA